MTREEKWSLYYEICDWITPRELPGDDPVIYKKLDFMSEFHLSDDDVNKIIEKLISDKKLMKAEKEDEYIAIKVCDICGRTYEFLDVQASKSNTIYLGFGSKYDLNIFNYDVCCECFDKMIDLVLPLFPKSPLDECDFYNDEEGYTSIESVVHHDTDPF